MTEDMDQATKAGRPRRRLTTVQIALVGMSGYLLGSFFPAGYINYIVRKTFFSETLVSEPPSFDRSKLRGAKAVSVQQLIAAVDANPNKFRADFDGKPVVVSGTVQYFLDTDSGEGEATLTLETGIESQGVFLTFDDGKQPLVIGLRKGGPVRATCIVTGTTDAENVHMSHCEVTPG